MVAVMTGTGDEEAMKEDVEEGKATGGSGNYYFLCASILSACLCTAPLR